MDILRRVLHFIKMGTWDPHACAVLCWNSYLALVCDLTGHSPSWYLVYYPETENVEVIHHRLILKMKYVSYKKVSRLQLIKANTGASVVSFIFVT